MNTPQPLFTIATITYNSGKWVRQAIESVLASSFSDFEYLVSDDCSTDDTWDIVQQYNDPRIRSWRNAQNLGEYPNRNKVLNEAKGRYIFYLDGDDVLYKNTLRNLAEYIAAFPEAGMIWGVLTPTNNYVVLPYLFEPKTTVKLLYIYSNYISIIGFSETVFLTDALRLEGGLNSKYSIGDIYIRKKLALTQKVLFVPLGLSFWRNSQNQASSKTSKGYKNITESFSIDREIINDPENPLTQFEKRQLMLYIKSTLIRRLIKTILFKFKLRSFLKVFFALDLKLKDLFLIFRKYEGFELPVADVSEPLTNDYNFIKRGDGK